MADTPIEYCSFQKCLRENQQLAGLRAEYAEAEKTLRRAIALSSEDYDFPRNNLEAVLEEKAKL